METFYWIITSTVIVSAISLVGVIALSFNKLFLQKILFILVSLAAGAMLGNAFVHLLPEAYAHIENGTLAGATVFVGMMLFFVLEKVFRWHHAHGATHDEECLHSEEHELPNGNHPLGRLVLVADGIHNLADGAIIAAAFLVDIDVGVATTIAIILHEIPQEIGDFGLLVHAGYSRTRALLWNLCSGSVAVIGALLVYFLGSAVDAVVPYIIALSAGSFLYIAGSDLLPELHITTNTKRSFIQLITLGIGAIIVIALVSSTEGSSHGEGEHFDEALPVAIGPVTIDQ